MKNITRRSFLKRGGGGIAALSTVPSFGSITSTPKKQKRTYAWSTAIEEEAHEENNLKNEVKGLMEKTHMDIEYYPRELASSSHTINPSEIVGYDMPVEKLYEARKRLTEFIKEAAENPDDYRSINLYEWMDLSRSDRC